MAQPVAIGEVRAQDLLELDEQLARRPRIMAVALEFADDLPLPGDGLLALGDMGLGERQVLLPHPSVLFGWDHAVHAATPPTVRSPWGGATNSVSEDNASADQWARMPPQEKRFGPS